MWAFDVIICTWRLASGECAPGYEEVTPDPARFVTIQACARVAIERSRALELRPGWREVITGVMCRELPGQDT